MTLSRLKINFDVSTIILFLPKTFPFHEKDIYLGREKKNIGMGLLNE